MSKSEMPTKEKILIQEPRVVRVSDHFESIRHHLAAIYYRSWNAEGLCADMGEAERKIHSFDPDEAYALLDDRGRPIALVNTLLTDEPNIDAVKKRFSTHALVEEESAKRIKVMRPTYRICFSIAALPDYRVLSGGTDVSVARFLLTHLPKGARRLAYSRWPAVDMHRHLGAEIAAVLDNSRPEDTASKGQNVLMLYPD